MPQKLPPQMPFFERMARSKAKQDAALAYISSEVYTTKNIIAELLNLSDTRARALVDSLEKSGCVASEMHMINGRMVKVIGITQHGNVMQNKFNSPVFQKGRINSAYVQHTTQTQQIRILFEKAGWKWTVGREFFRKGLRKVPDGMATSPTGLRVAIELERHAKSVKRYGDVLASHLHSSSKSVSLWDQIWYICPADGLAARIQKMLSSIKTVTIKNQHVDVPEKLFAERFKFFDMTKLLKNGVPK
jgi:DNA-binding MarR family transcriptional regulator